MGWVKLICLCSLISQLMLGCKAEPEAGTEAKISFNKDIRPILTEHCTGCHGGVSKQAGVSFVYQKEAFGRGHSGRLTIKPGDPDGSELIARLETSDKRLRMPYNAPPLSPEKIQKLRRWIKQGAKWEKHWAFKKPVKRSPPAESTDSENPIDQFIQRSLRSQNLQMNVRADKYRQLRRLSLDLIGLPPTLSEIEEFIADQSDTAYETQVDRLLASPHFGERWAAMWLDLARYADSQGYTRDEYRASWPYRDWVIKAFNKNLPYDQFVTKQLAGDLLPNNKLPDLIATGFHRQTPVNSEGGTDDEEFRLVAVMDRVATTWQAINGLTMECVQCHSHPYDPIEHQEYYQSLAFFNTQRDADRRHDGPHLLIADDKEKQSKVFDWQMRLNELENLALTQTHQLNQSVKDWTKLPIVRVLSDDKTALQDEISVLKKRIQRLDADSQKYALRFAKRSLEQRQARLAQLSDSNYRPQPLTVKNGELNHKAPFSAKTRLVMTTHPVEHRQALAAIKFSVLPLNEQKARHTPEFAVSLDHIDIYKRTKNGQSDKLAIKDFLSLQSESIADQLTRLADGKNRGAANGLYSHRLFSPLETIAVFEKKLNLEVGDAIEVVIKQYQYRNLNEGMPSELHRFKISASQDESLIEYAVSQARQQLIAQYKQVNEQLKPIKGTKLPIMQEQDKFNQRGTALFSRGNFLAKQGPLLTPETPAIFPPMVEQKKLDRLALANWFFDKDQPLTARVAVNHFWQQLFGQGLVRTVGDFGSSGEPPSHPELLDYLALTFQNNFEWNIKKLIKLMVMSDTYRRSSNVTNIEQDRQNLWLSRANKRRLSAEMIRDQALVTSGLFNAEMFGKPVMPPQPSGIWGRKGRVIKDWQTANDANRYRRAIYTFIKRAYIYPSFLTFDMETREISHGKRIATNTPLQALVTLNDPVFVEAANALGVLIQKDYLTDKNIQRALRRGFLKVTSRPPTENEISEIKNTWMALLTATDDQQTLAFSQIGALLLNLDAALTR
ncbi:PSD1 and planctomycete cytochrome C domain-containing protein [Gayadomonas joobiniege]|uniref:PSD1 and planctomycete cytochrome C domain-containing protein n=1 Tax=Gayadomonas joobiniege TaxID=1234606 RepID=UPI00036AF9EB|nr:PSD1 and planctomycete cytochrome C domain-containing protein [Gayadomonas joobiniege]